MVVYAHPLPRLRFYRLTVADLNGAFVARRSSCSKPTLRYGTLDTPCVASRNRPGGARIPMVVQVLLS